MEREDSDESPSGSSVDPVAPSTSTMKDPPTSKNATELALQLGAMTLKNIVQETEGGQVSLSDLCDLFASRAKVTEREAVGEAAPEVQESLKKFPGMFVILEDADESEEVKVQLADNISIPPLLSGVLKISGILKTKGSLGVDDLSGYVRESCTEDEMASLGERSESLRETLLSLPNVLHVSGEMVSMVVGKELKEKVSEMEEHAGNKVEEEKPCEVSASAETKDHEEKPGDVQKEADDDKDDDDDVTEPEQMQYDEENVSQKPDEDHDRTNIHQKQQTIEEVPQNIDQNIDIELMASSDEFESDEEVDVEEVIETESSDSVSEPSVNDIYNAVRRSSLDNLENGAQAASIVSSSKRSSIDETSSQLPIGDTAPSEDLPTISHKFAKQQGVMKIKQILRDKGPISVQLLGSVFGGTGTAEERDAVGRKVKELLETIEEFDDVFCVETYPEKGEIVWDQTYVSVKSLNDDEVSLAFSRAVLKVQDNLEERGGKLKMSQLSTFFNQTSTADERKAVGKGPPTLKQTLLELPELFKVLDDHVCLVRRKQQSSKKKAQQQTEDTAPTQPQIATNHIGHFKDFSNINLQLGILTLKGLVQEQGPIALQDLCSRFGHTATSEERDAVGRKQSEVLETLKKIEQVFFIKQPKDGLQSKIQVRLVKGDGANETPVPLAKAIFKVIWFLKEKGAMDVKHLSSRLGQNSTLDEREAVGKSPGELKKTLKGLSKLFSVSSSTISTVGNEPHVVAAIVLILPQPPVPRPGQQPSQSRPGQQPLQSRPGQQPSQKQVLNIIPTVTRCLKQNDGSCDLTHIIKWINANGSTAEKNKYGQSNHKELLKQLKTLPYLFQVQGSKVVLVNHTVAAQGDQGANLSLISNPMQGTGSAQSPSKVIPSIEVVFDTQNGNGDSWRNVMFSQTLMKTNLVSQSQIVASASINNSAPITMTSGGDKPTTKLQRALEAGLGILTSYLQQAKISTIIQLGGTVGTKLTAAERKAVGKNPSSLYDTLASCPNRFAIAGPFVGVKDHQDLVTGVANLVTFLETKGRCEIALLFGKLIQSGTAKQKAALGTDLETFTETIGTMPGVFTLYETSAYLNNGSDGKPRAQTSMNKDTALNQKVLWALTTGTTAQKLTNTTRTVILQSDDTTSSEQRQDAAPSSEPSSAFSRLDNPSVNVTNVPIGDSALCQEFKQNCLDKYDYPIIGLAVNKGGKQIAIAGWEGHVYLFDMAGAGGGSATSSSAVGMGILEDAISSTTVLKVS